MCSTEILSPEREYFQYLTQISLFLNGFTPHLLYQPLLKRYFEAQEQTETEFFILCDNDIVLSTPDTLEKALKIMEKHPEYSQLGLGWKQNMDSERGNSWLTPKEGDVWDADHCGGCVIIRKGTLKDLGYKAEYENGYGDDRVMGKIARELGHKVGIIPNLYFHNLGEAQNDSHPL